MSLARQRRGASSATDTSLYSFACSACGKCCNSGPQLSLPELFHHERRFVGCLTLRRVRHVRAGEALLSTRATSADELASRQLADALLFAVPGADDRLALATQALYDAGLSSCPALSADNTCEVQLDRKPEACRVAPLEAWLPDRMQHLVLGQRLSGGDYHGTDCISRGGHADASKVVTRKLTVVQTSARDALEKRRADLRLDKRYWGEAVFASLRGSLVSDPAALQRIPSEGFVSIPPAPLLLVLASVSERCRQRCLQFLHAQLHLITTTRVSSAGAELAAIERTSRLLLNTLAQPRPLPPHPERAEIETWLGLPA